MLLKLLSYIFWQWTPWNNCWTTWSFQKVGFPSYKSVLPQHNIQHKCYDNHKPISSGPGMNKNLLFSFRRWWAAITLPSFPNCCLPRYTFTYSAYQVWCEPHNKIYHIEALTWFCRKNWKKGCTGGNKNFPWERIEKELLPHSRNHREPSVTLWKSSQEKFELEIR